MRDSRCQHKQSQLQQNNSNYQIKLRHACPNKRTKRGYPLCPVQYNTQISRSIRTKVDQGDTNWERRGQDITICR